jgi:hypothetical protein
MKLQAQPKSSFWRNLFKHGAHDPGSPPAPRPPRVDESAWAKSVDQARISDHLTVHDLGLIVFNETQSYSDHPDSNEPIGTARQKLAHSVINADHRWGAKRQQSARTALPIEPSHKALDNPEVRSAYDSSMRAAREAFLSGTDPTNGALYLNQRINADRSNQKYRGGTRAGVPLRTQSGPYRNSYPNKEVLSNRAWLNTYGER